MSVAQTNRLSTGGQIDRSRTVTFTCNGRRYDGYAGDTLASALLANRVGVIGRSFKFHRPRGILSAGIEEPNALFRVDIGKMSMPVVQATMQPLVDGLVATTENVWPSVDFDLGRLLDYTHGLWPAGFYNKTFKWPNWHCYEGFVRRLAGVGRLPEGADPTEYFQHNLHCDVLVIGGGPSGLTAALAAARSRARVVLMECEPRLGGSLLFEGGEIDGRPALEWLEHAVRDLECMSSVRILKNTTAAGYYDHNVLLAVDRSHANQTDRPVERLWIIRAKQVILATGAIEQPLVFTHNDRPGILLAGAVRRYLSQYAVTVGRAVVIATNNDDAYRTAFALHDAGIEVPAVVDARPEPSPEIDAQARSRGLEVISNAVPVDTAGRRGIQEVKIAQLSPDGRPDTRAMRTVACDAMAMSGGWSPTVHLYSQAGGCLRYDSARACFVPDRCRQAVRVIGRANGNFELAHAMEESAAAGRAAAHDAGFEPAPFVAPSVRGAPAWGIRPVRHVASGPSSRQWVDFRHDVTVADIELSVRENYVSVEHLKRYTTTGMAVDQGKTSNLNALMLLAGLTDRPVPEVGTTTFRPMYSPVSMGAISANMQREFYVPLRRLPAHRWHQTHGAEFDDYGGWQRPACYPRAGESREAAIAREVRAVRNAVGFFEASPLSKIEVRGPDAAAFLNRLYVNNALTLKPGRVRYGILLNESGIIIDDGVFVCMAPDHFLIYTTSAGAQRTAVWIDRWHQCEWPEFRVVISVVTTQWAVLTLTGPRARELLQSFDSDIDFSAEAFPHMCFRSGHFADVPARVQRVSFSGELSFEVNVPAKCAADLADSLMERGAACGIEPIGIESLDILRLEKGFFHVGIDTDGTTNALDVGFGNIVAKKQEDFIGRRSLMRPNDQRPDRRQIVGLEPVNLRDRLIAAAHLVRSDRGSWRSEGYITSACFSPTLGRSIGLGLLEGGFSRKGEIVTVFNEGRLFKARVVDPSFYDPEGGRMRG